MANTQDKSLAALVAPNQNEREALFRRAAKVTRTSQLLINETEELLARTRELIKKSENRLIPK